MPVAASVVGTLTCVASGGSAAAGTLSAIGYSANPAAGTLAVDRRTFLAFYSRVRLTRVDVYVDGELMPNLVDAVDIEETLDDPIAHATFVLSDKRCAFFDPASLSNGSHEVQVDLWAGPPGSVVKWTAFIGDTEVPQNSMPYRPRGTFQAVSRFAKAAEIRGCLNVPAMSGLRRGDVVAAFAESAGFPLDGTALGGGLVRKAINIGDKTPVQLIQEYGELEGWFARVTTDGSGIEVLNEDRILSGTPAFVFDESSTFDVQETAPSRPVNDWILSGTQLTGIPHAGESTIVTTRTETGGPAHAPQWGVTDATLEERLALAGLTQDSKTVTDVTTDCGVEIKRVVEQWDKVVLPGVVAMGPAFQIVSRVTTEIEWEPFLGYDDKGGRLEMPSLQMNSRRVTTELLMGIPCSVDTGFVWIGGAQMTKAFADLEVAEIVEETFAWFPTTPTGPQTRSGVECTQASCLSIRQQLYSPLSPSGSAYADGAKRRDASYAFIEVQRDHTYGPFTMPQWLKDQQAASQNDAGFQPSTIPFRWFLSSPGVESYGQIGPYVPDDYAGVRAGLVSSAIAPIATLSAPPEMGSADLAQVNVEAIISEYDAVEASGWPRSQSSPGMVEFAESLDELDAIAKRRIRRACSDQLDIPHRLIPFLRVGDHVAATNHARSIVGVDAYVTKVKRTAAVANASMRQVTTVKVPVDWI